MASISSCVFLPFSLLPFIFLFSGGFGEVVGAIQVLHYSSVMLDEALKMADDYNRTK
jgi:hypothetical protein